MKPDYLLVLINSKVPKKPPSFYWKSLICLVLVCFVLSILSAIVGLHEPVSGSIFAVLVALSVMTLMFLLCLSVLYNDESDARDFISIYAPSITASEWFNGLGKILRLISRAFVISFSYALLAFLPLLLLLSTYAVFKS